MGPYSLDTVLRGRAAAPRAELQASLPLARCQAAARPPLPSQGYSPLLRPHLQTHTALLQSQACLLRSCPKALGLGELPQLPVTRALQAEAERPGGARLRCLAPPCQSLQPQAVTLA